MKIVAWILGIAAVIALICVLLPIILSVVAWIVAVVATGYILWQVFLIAFGPFDK